MKKLVIAFLLLIVTPLMLTAQRNYMKNDHVKMSSNKKGGKYHIDYQFKDQWGNMQYFKLSYNAKQAERMSAQFGLPNSFFERYYVTEANLRARRQQLRDGMFQKDGNTVVIDYDAVVSYYAPVFCKPIARLIRKQLQEMGLDSRVNRIEMAMKFIQDIPYGVPRNSKNKFYRGGINTPPEVLVEGYGDCDSKTLLFAGILSYLIDPDDIIFFNQENHVLTFVATGNEAQGSYINWEGKRYYKAETAGPGRRALGESGRGDQNRGIVIPFNFRPTT